MQAKSIIADENINFSIIEKLRDEGFSVFSIMEECGGISDEAVITLSKEKQAILLTEDSDFGEWVFAHGVDSICIIYMRYHYKEVKTMTTNLLNLLQNKKYNFQNSFFVLTPKKLRVRSI